MNEKILRVEFDLEVLGDRLDRALELIVKLEDMTVSSYSHTPELTLALVRNEIRFYRAQEKELSRG